MAPKKEKRAAASKPAATKTKTADKGVKKVKATKDKNAPKKGLSAFMLFSNANRDKVKKENPDAGFGDIGKLIGAAWKEIEPAEKKKYEDMAKKDKERAEKEMASYNAKKEKEEEMEDEKEDAEAEDDAEEDED